MPAAQHTQIFLVIATTIIGSTQSLAPAYYTLTPINIASSSRSPSTTTTTTTTLFRRHPRDANWEDDSKSSRVDPSVTEYLPPWRNHEPTGGSGGRNPRQAISGSQATPGKSRPFTKGFFEVSPQAENNNNPGLSQLAQQAEQMEAQVQEVQGRAAAAVQSVARGGSPPSSQPPSSTSAMMRKIKWPLVRDPPGVTSEFPLLMTRIFVTMLSTIATWYLHLFNGYSPVLASSACTLLVSTCFDRRLGQAAFCGSFAGMCGGHLAPNISIALILAGLTSLSYEVLIHINNFCLGIGGRLGAAAFLATGVLAKYQSIASVGRKMRRGLWKAGAGPSDVVVSMILFHALGSVATIFLRECSDDSAAADPVRASSVVGLLGSLFLKDPTAILALYGGSFVGMALPSRLMYGNAPGRAKVGQPQTPVKLFMSFAGAGAIAGLIHAITIHNGLWGGGWGGKAGLCAFAGCWVYRGLGNTLDFLQRKGK